MKHNGSINKLINPPITKSSSRFNTCAGPSMGLQLKSRE
jgi:hypothetical protein